MPIPLDPTINITRSFAFKLGLPAYSSADFFMSAGTQCLESQAHETANRLYDLCYDQVSAEVATYRHGQAAIADEVLHPDPERTQAPEVSPFRVTAAPTKERWGTENIETDDQRMERESQEKIEPSNLDELKTKGSNPGTAAPTRRRGRPPKTAAATEARPATQPEARQPDSQPAGEPFKATDDDIPKEMGGTAVVPPGPDLKAKHEEIRAAEAQKASNTLGSGDRSKAGPQLVPPAKPVLSQVERLAGIEIALAKDGKRTPESIHSALGIFMKAFLNTPDRLKKPPMPEYEPIVPIMERIIETNPGVLMADPAKAGLESGVGYNKLIRHVDKWSPELKDLAISLAVNRYPENCYDLLDFLHNIAKLGNLDRQLYTFMLVFKNFNAAVAMGLKSASDETQKPMTELVDGLDLATCTEGELLGRLSGNPKSQKPSEGKLWDEA